MTDAESRKWWFRTVVLVVIMVGVTYLVSWDRDRQRKKRFEAALAAARASGQEVKLYLNGIGLERDNVFLVPQGTGSFNIWPSLENRALLDFPGISVAFEIGSIITNRISPNNAWTMLNTGWTNKDANGVFALTDSRLFLMREVRAYPPLILNATNVQGAGTFLRVLSSNLNERVRVHWFFMTNLHTTLHLTGQDCVQALRQRAGAHYSDELLMNGVE